MILSVVVLLNNGLLEVGRLRLVGHMSAHLFLLPNINGLYFLGHKSR